MVLDFGLLSPLPHGTPSPLTSVNKGEKKSRDSSSPGSETSFRITLRCWECCPLQLDGFHGVVVCVDDYHGVAVRVDDRQLSCLEPFF